MANLTRDPTLTLSDQRGGPFFISLSKLIANVFWMGISISKPDGFSSWRYFAYWTQRVFLLINFFIWLHFSKFFLYKWTFNSKNFPKSIALTEIWSLISSLTGVSSTPILYTVPYRLNRLFGLLWSKIGSLWCRIKYPKSPDTPLSLWLQVDINWIFQRRY